MDIARVRKKLRKSKGKKAASEKRPRKEAKAPSSETGAGQEELKTPVPETLQAEVKAAVSKGPKTQSPPGKPTETGGGVPAGEEGSVELVVFSMDREDYSFKVLEVQEIFRPHSITRVPTSDPVLVGVTSLRGTIMPVIDIRRRLKGVSKAVSRKKSSVLILKGPKGPIGALIGRVTGFINIPRSDLKEPPARTGEEGSCVEWVLSYNDRFISVLNMQKILDFKAALEAK